MGGELCCPELRFTCVPSRQSGTFALQIKSVQKLETNLSSFFLCLRPGVRHNGERA
jgi:hypothetical protein